MPKNSLEGLRILVLEDEYLIAMDVEQICRDHGAEDVSISRTAPDASADEAASFDVAIIDVMLGGVSMFPFAEQLRDREVPFIFATGYADVHEKFSAFPNVRIVGKPYNVDELIGAILEAAERPSAMSAHDVAS